MKRLKELQRRTQARLRTPVAGILAGALIATLFATASITARTPEDPEDKTKKSSIPVFERQRQCKKYEGKYISYYDSVFKVVNCIRHKLESAQVYDLTRAGGVVHDVEGHVIRSLSEGKPYRTAGNQPRTCVSLLGQYITFSATDIYRIEKVQQRCVKRLFPDWETYDSDRQNRFGAASVISPEIYSLSWDEFIAIPEGPAIPSVLTAEQKQLLSGEAEIDIIPISDACRGINGHYVSYLDKIYHIRKCHKYEVDAQKFSRNHGNDDSVLTEISSQVWLSLPDGLDGIQG